MMRTLGWVMVSMVAGCASHGTGSTDVAASERPVASTAPAAASAPPPDASSVSPALTASSRAPEAAKSRIASELGAYTLTTISAPKDVTANRLTAKGFVDPTTFDFDEKHVGGFPISAKWGAPATADFAAKLAAILRDDASYDFDVVTRCAPDKGVIGFVLHHEPVCGPKATCPLDAVQIVMNFPCHQIFVTTREPGVGAKKAASWGAHFGPAKDKVLDLLGEGFPKEASFLKTLR